MLAGGVQAKRSYCRGNADGDAIGINRDHIIDTYGTIYDI